MPKHILEISGMYKQYAGAAMPALSGVHFEVQEGEIFALLGPNGAGKSTLIGCLSGVLRRSGGVVKIGGFDPEKNPEKTKPLLGVVEQELGVDVQITVRESLEFARGLFGLPPCPQLVEQTLAGLHLAEKANTVGRQLSGGMKRRAMVARALVTEPKMIILDEPTAGVDVELREQLWEYLLECKKARGLTLLLTTHYLEEAERLADRVGILRGGELVACAPPRELLAGCPRRLVVEEEGRPSAEYRLRQGEDLHEYLEKHTGRIINLSLEEPRLEDAFLHIVRQK